MSCFQQQQPADNMSQTSASPAHHILAVFAAHEAPQAATGGHMHIQVTPASNVPGIGIVMVQGPGPMLPAGGLGCGGLDGGLDGERFDG